MTNILIWGIFILSIAFVLIRPLKLPEATWAICGALLLIVLKLITPAEGLKGVLSGLDVYLFLTGMMLLAETSREEGLFDWLAGHAIRLSRGSPTRLFLLIYLVGTIVTIFLSNDATAVVLTPSVAAAMRSARIKNPLPYLLICAFIANAASFVLPISNPANLVIYGTHMPSLLHWLHLFIFPSLVAIVITYFTLKATQQKDLKMPIETNLKIQDLSYGGKTAFAGIICTGIILLISSALNIQLGLPTAVTGLITSIIVLVRTRKSPILILKGITWSILLLVAGLFVLVEGLNKTGLTQYLSSLLEKQSSIHPAGTYWLSGVAIAIDCNLMNNLPAGLIAGQVSQSGHLTEMIKSAFLIGVDLGPNLSVTGSLATILWLVALRRDGLEVSAGAFIKLGLLIMFSSLIFSLAALLI